MAMAVKLQFQIVTMSLVAAMVSLVSSGKAFGNRFRIDLISLMIIYPKTMQEILQAHSHPIDVNVVI